MLFERLRRPRDPAGYRPGVTLDKVRRNLRLVDYQLQAPGVALARLRDAGPLLQVQELTESQLLMHLVLCQWQYRCSALDEGDLSLELRHTGAFRRQGMRWMGDAPAPLRAMIAQPGAFFDALLALDFKRCHLQRQEGHWNLRIEHMGASEVVNRMPAFRRYIAVSADQRTHLQAVFDGFASRLPAC